MAERVEFEHECAEDTQSVVRWLDALREGLARGELELASGQQTLTLRPRGLLHARVRARQRGRERVLSLRLTWNEEPPESAQKVQVRAPRRPATGPDGPG